MKNLFGMTCEIIKNNIPLDNENNIPSQGIVFDTELSIEENYERLDDRDLSITYILGDLTNDCLKSPTWTWDEIKWKVR